MRPKLSPLYVAAAAVAATDHAAAAVAVAAATDHAAAAAAVAAAAVTVVLSLFAFHSFVSGVCFVNFYLIAFVICLFVNF